jgi:hypothetical protein
VSKLVFNKTDITVTVVVFVSVDIAPVPSQLLVIVKLLMWRGLIWPSAATCSSSSECSIKFFGSIKQTWEIF